MINRTRDDEQALQPERAWQHANTTSSDPTRWRGAWWWTSSAVASKLRANDYTERAKELPKTTCTQEWSKDTVKRHSTPPHLSREKKITNNQKNSTKFQDYKTYPKHLLGLKDEIFWVFVLWLWALSFLSSAILISCVGPLWLSGSFVSLRNSWNFSFCTSRVSCLWLDFLVDLFKCYFVLIVNSYSELQKTQFWLDLVETPLQTEMLKMPLEPL